MGTLRAKMEDVMDLCSLAEGTRGLYLKAVENLAVYFKRSPDELTLDEVQRYLLHLIKDRGYAHGGLVQEACTVPHQPTDLAITTDHFRAAIVSQSHENAGRRGADVAKTRARLLARAMN